ncbi:MAG: VWA domain-containing protein [Treponema sp.]|nr:VWA domain-containing protein [Treponema sp.]
MRYNRLILVFSLLLAAVSAFAQTESTADTMEENLTVTKEDIFIERNSGRSIGTSTDGFNLYVRKKPGVQSVMLVETTKDPEGKEDNFAYRSPTYNSLNGDEIRYLDGEKLDSRDSRYSLITSTVGYLPRLGECFLIYIPRRMVYGYPWTRNGSVQISEGTFINIRTFEKKYGDYTGRWKDNPFMFNFTYTPKENADETTLAETIPEEDEEEWEEDEVILSDEYSPVAADSFRSIAKEGRGRIVYSKGPSTLPEDLKSLLSKMKVNAQLDVVFAIDTTGSMQDDLESLRKRWIPSLAEQAKEFGSVRFGLLLYRDYFDNYNYDGLPVKIFPFTSSVEELSANLDTIVIRGNEGGDVPEAVNEALYASITEFDWRSGANKQIILIGDAEPHAYPKGKKKISGETVQSLAKEKDISLNCIILPNTL